MEKRPEENVRGWSQGITRRAVLKSLAYGAGTAALAPSLARNAFGAALVSAPSPDPIWTYTSKYGFAGYPLFDNGTIVLNGAADLGNNFAGVVTSVDIQTAASRWSRTYPGAYVSSIIEAGPLSIVTTNDGHMHALSSVDGSEVWTQPYSVQKFTQPVLADGRIFFLDATGYVRAIDPDGNTVWAQRISIGYIQEGSTPVVSGGAVIFRGGSIIFALDEYTGAELWTYNRPPLDQKDIAVGSGNVFFTLQSASSTQIMAVDISTGQLAFATPHLSANISAPAFYSGAVYVGDDRGQLYAMDGSTGEPLWQTAIGGSLDVVRFFFDDGIAYFTAVTGGGGKAFAVDVTSRGQDIVSWAPPNGQAFVLGVESGVCYVLNESTAPTMVVNAVNLATVVHQFFAESELMADDYVAGNGGASGRNPAFRSHVRLVDARKNPRANKSVKVWASAPVTVTTGGTSYALDVASSGKSAWIQTDALGELSLVSQPKGVDTPALYLWGNFMETDEAIVLYPDHDVITRLANVQGADFQNAKSFDGTSIFPANFTDFDNFASTVRNAIGAAQSSLSATQHSHMTFSKSPTSTGVRQIQLRPQEEQPLLFRSGAKTSSASYIAYPQSNRNLVYQPQVSDPDRKWLPGAQHQWTTIITPGSVKFTPGATITAPAVGSFWKDFENFVDDCVDGAENVGKIVWDGFTAVVNDLYKFAVDTLEKAVSVVTAVFRTVCRDIERVVEYLSYLFDWGSILSIKNQLKEKAQNGFNGLITWLGNQESAAYADVDAFFKTAEGNAVGAFRAVGSLLGASTLQSKQQNGNDPQALYGAHGAKSYAKTQWLIEKVRDNIGSAKISSSTAAAFALGDEDTIAATFESLVKSIGDTIASTSAFSKIPKDLDTIFSRFSALASDPSQLVTKTFTEVLNLVADMVVAMLQFANAIADDILKALQTLLQSILNMVTGSIDIPFVSDFYRAISGSDLSILDLSCLLIAIPVTIVQKAMASASELGITLNDNIGYLFAAAVYAVFDPLTDLTESTVPLKFLYVALCTILQALNFPTDIATNRAGDYIYYAATAIPLVMSGIDVSLALKGGSEAFDALAPTILNFYGVAMISASAILGVQDPVFRGPDYLLMIQNIFSSIPFMAKPLSYGGEKGRVALVVIDAVCDVTALGLGVAQHAV